MNHKRHCYHITITVSCVLRTLLLLLLYVSFDYIFFELGALHIQITDIVAHLLLYTSAAVTRLLHAVRAMRTMNGTLTTNFRGQKQKNFWHVAAYICVTSFSC